MEELQIDLVEIAYRKLKQYVYYEQLDLALRNKLALFEEDDSFEDNLEKLKRLISKVEETKEPDEVDQLYILDQFKLISFNYLPKKIEKHQKKSQLSAAIKYFSNKNTAEIYNVSGFNYFIDAPIELHILCTIWLMKAGRLIEPDLSDTCYNFRLNEKVLRQNDTSSHLYKLYYDEYANWRDNGISKAINLHKKEKMDICIVSMDLKGCFYSIKIDFENLNKYLKQKCEKEDLKESETNLILYLTELLQSIHEEYFLKIKPYFRTTHNPELFGKGDCPLPIGLVSSGILCNWYLNNLDKDIVKKVKPAYYGRYVDDIFIVIANPVVDGTSRNDKIMHCFDRYLIDTGILSKKTVKTTKCRRRRNREYKFSGSNSEKKVEYFVKDNHRLVIQTEKLFIHFYEKDNSIALLQKFKKRLEKNASSFFHLPSNESELDIFDKAYDVIYEGSKNIFRTVEKVIENKTDFSHVLTQIIITLSKTDVNDEFIRDRLEQIFQFYNGINYIRYCLLWEKIFSFTLIKGRYKECEQFYQFALNTINSIAIESIQPKRCTGCKSSSQIKEKLRNDLKKYLNYSFLIPLALLSEAEQKKALKFFSLDPEKGNQFLKRSLKFRNANLIRHHYIMYPLLNYAEGYGGSLVDHSVLLKTNSQRMELDDKKIKYSPRYIHFDEYQHFKLLENLNSISLNPLTEGQTPQDAEDVFKEYCKMVEGKWKTFVPIKDRLCINRYTVDCLQENIDITDFIIRPEETKSAKKQIKIGIANLQLSEKDYKASYEKFRSPNISFERLMRLNDVLNLSKEEFCEYLILPELSIPQIWLPFMINFSRRHQIGLIFGIEYWIVNNVAYNFIITTMPFEDEDKYKSCCISIRNKNHYAPKEEESLLEEGLSLPSKLIKEYHLIQWNCIQFSSYSCFELADIRHRGLFRSKLDILFACEWNKDIKYFSNIMESSIRDLHCYAVQVNNPKYGDSRILQPTKSESMNVIQVKGGENNTILTATLDIEKLRKYQWKTRPRDNSLFKPVPPGFDKEEIDRRCHKNYNVGKCSSDKSI